MITASFTPDIVACNLAATSKKHLLQTLSNLAAAHAGLCERKLLSAIIKLENLGSTGIGGGMALPHAVIETPARPVAMLATLQTAIDFDSPDDIPVDVVALVLGTADDSNGYLSMVNKASRALHHGHARLRNAGSEADILATLGDLQDAAA